MDPTSRNDLIDEILVLNRTPPADHDTMRAAYRCCETHELFGLRDWLRCQHRSGTFKPHRLIDPQAVKRDRMMREFRWMQTEGNA